MIKLVRGCENKIEVVYNATSVVEAVSSVFRANNIVKNVPLSRKGGSFTLTAGEIDAIGLDFLISTMEVKSYNGEVIQKLRIPTGIIPDGESNRGFDRIVIPLVMIREVRGGHEGLNDYKLLSNKPQINGMTLIGNKTAEELGLAAKTEVGMVSRLVEKDAFDGGGYFYEADYETFDDDFGYKYIADKYSNGGIEAGQCSSVRSGNFYGRNYDWLYDDKVTFIVRTPGGVERHASIAICTSTDYITKDAVARREVTTEQWKEIPFHALDGINDCGVVCSMNVVHADSDRDSGWKNHTDEGSICGMAMVRYVLDHATSAREGAEMIAAKAWMPLPSLVNGYALHYMIADETETWIVEDGRERNVSLFATKAMTNFRCFDVRGSSPDEYAFTDSEGKVDLGKLVSYDPYGNGVERYNAMSDSVRAAGGEGIGLDGMKNLMESIRFSKAYDSEGDANCPSEFAGISPTEGAPLMKVNEVDDQNRWYIDNGVHELWKNRTRHDSVKFWQTVHSSVYDIKNKKLVVRTQENYGNAYSFGLNDLVFSPIDMGGVPLASDVTASTASILNAVQKMIISMRGE